ncbi:GrpB family protein [Nakamurella sp. A5-74]|uniref:GrpB family protein n=1 Tax=Nakamurella sp. A5-74 TaxID=3158264 RepID=A0AAU8DUY7_9ACTN
MAETGVRAAGGERRSNIHLRPTNSASARLALLFRDHLRASPQRIVDWSEFKTRVAQHTDDLASYGQIKLPAWRLLMDLAEIWAQQTAWRGVNAA